MAHSVQNKKYTAVLPSECVDELKNLAAKNIIPSVNFGIRLAVERFIAQCRRELYEQQLKEASNDSEFMRRTLTAQNDFAEYDTEVDGKW